MCGIFGFYLKNSDELRSQEYINRFKLDLFNRGPDSFNYNSKKSSPETQIKIDIDQGGVVYNYEVDYGDYKMYANLVKLDSLTEKKC